MPPARRADTFGKITVKLRVHELIGKERNNAIKRTCESSSVAILKDGSGTLVPPMAIVFTCCTDGVVNNGKSKNPTVRMERQNHELQENEARASVRCNEHERG